MSEDDRKVSYPPGETVITEQFVRFTHADGTVRDTEPVRIDRAGEPPAPITRALRGMLDSAARRRDVQVVRFRRTVVVTASEWSEFTEQETQA